MKSLSMVTWVILAIVTVAIGYGVFFTNGSQTEVETQLNDITPLSERMAVDAQILSRPAVAEVESFRTFGEQPVQPNAATLNRVNPFDNL